MLATQSTQEQKMPIKIKKKNSVAILIFKIAGVNNTIHISECDF